MEVKQIGPYHIVDKLGSGSKTHVYLVRDKQGRKYALKVLLPIDSNRQQVKRLQREARILMKLFHPFITKVEEYHYYSPYHCIIMEYAEGQSLGSLLKLKKYKNGLSFKDVVQISWKVCKALQHAHTYKETIIHRDVKPDNIIVDGSWVKVTDFGLASIVSESMTDLPPAIGTPLYTSPEQAYKGRADARSDLYSLGIVMYHMITGQVPFEADAPLGIMEKHVNEIPKPLRELRPEVPSELEGIVNKAIRKSPNDRFQTAEEMCEALNHYASKKNISLEEVFYTKTQISVNWLQSGFKSLAVEFSGNLAWAIFITLLIALGLGPAANWLNGDGSVPNPVPTETQTSTQVPILTDTRTKTPSKTPSLTNTPTEIFTRTSTPTQTLTNTPSATPTNTVTATPTDTATATSTNAPRPISFPTVTQTQTVTALAPSLPPASDPSTVTPIPPEPTFTPIP